MVADERKEGTFCRIALLILLLLAAISSSQAEQLPIKTYKIADGLARDRINRIVQDSHGFLWFCTDEGLSRFDGYSFTNYGTDQGLPSRVVNNLLETREGIYLIATSDGLCRFNKTSKERFTVYRSAGNERARIINVLKQDSAGSIWCGTTGGLYRLVQENGQWRFHLIDLGLPEKISESLVVFALLEDRLGNLWAGTGNGLYRFLQDGRTEHYTTEQGLPSNRILSLLEDSAGKLWTGTTEGLCRLVAEPKENRLLVSGIYTTRDGLSSNMANSLLQTSDGRLWIGTPSGLNEMLPEENRDGRRFRIYSAVHGLSDISIQALAEDRDGNLWISTANSGAIKIARNGFMTYGVADGLGNDHISSIFENREHELFAISGKFSLNRLERDSVTAVRPNLPAESTNFGFHSYQTIFEDHTGDWWVPTGEGLYRFSSVRDIKHLAHEQPKAVYTTRDGLPVDRVINIFEDSHGDIWVGTAPLGHDALTRWERTTKTFHRYTKKDGIPQTLPHAFCEDAAGNLWIGFYKGGLARYSSGRFRLFTVADGLPENWIIGLYFDHAHRLWIATSRGGLSRVDNTGAEQPHFINYTTTEGLTSNEVTCITEDRWGFIYAGTGRGVDRIDPATDLIKHFTVADGLADNYINAAFQDNKGTLWFGTNHGLSRLVPEPDRPRPPPSILISRLNIAGLLQNISELGETEKVGLVLEPKQNQIQIDYFGLGFGMGERLLYQYRLEGANQDWSRPIDQRSINYANLSPGDYRFLVRAVSGEGVASSEPAVVAFTILPPVWLRWWFIALITITVGCAIYSVYRYRVQRLIEIERVRTRIATDLHDDIGSSLSQISVLCEVIRRRIERENEILEPLLIIADLSCNLIDSMSDIVWAINPERDRLSDLVQRMRRFASDIFTARNIEFNFHAPDSQKDMRMGADVRRELFLIFKESINNIIRHSECRRVEIEFMLEGGRLELILKDDGKGFDPDQIRDGNGLVNMQRRATRIGGTLLWSSSAGQGTIVRLRLPLGRRTHTT